MGPLVGGPMEGRVANFAMMTRLSIIVAPITGTLAGCRWISSSAAVAKQGNKNAGEDTFHFARFRANKTQVAKVIAFPGHTNPTVLSLRAEAPSMRVTNIA